MKVLLLVLNILALIGAVIWLILNPDWESLVTTIGCIAGLIAQYQSGGIGKIKMRQKGGKNSNNYQSSGDITVTRNER